MNLGKALKEIRTKKKLSQTAAAAAIGCQQSQLSDWEKSESLPSKTIQKVAAGYDIHPVVIIWMATELGDVKDKKKNAFKLLKPAMDGIIEGMVSGELK